jgi:hypothetical protein
LEEINRCVISVARPTKTTLPIFNTQNISNPILLIEITIISFLASLASLAFSAFRSSGLKAINQKAKLFGQENKPEYLITPSCLVR